MHEWQSLSHVKWECKYHLVIIPKYRRKVLYGRMRKEVGVILRAKPRVSDGNPERIQFFRTKYHPGNTMP